jgi:uncharacterized membrane protein
MYRFGVALAVGVCLWITPSAQAKPEYLDVFYNAYKPYAARLEARNCANCHVSESDYTLNPYGKQIAQEKKASGQRSGLPVAILRKIEPLDADGDGVSNLDEIKAGTAPGDMKSSGPSGVATPTTAPSKEAQNEHEAEHAEETKREKQETEHEEARRPAEAVTTPPAEPPRSKISLPKNGFHPAIVHFPIALFIAGLLLDLIGLWTNQRTLLYAGWYNLVLAAISAVIGVLTGFAALFLQSIPLAGIMRNHMLLGIGSAFVMWMMVSLRVHRHEQMNIPIRLLYAVLAVAGLLMIAYAGHLGGVFVYGE